MGSSMDLVLMSQSILSSSKLMISIVLSHITYKWNVLVVIMTIDSKRNATLQLCHEEISSSTPPLSEDEDDPGGFRKLSSVVKVIDNIRADCNVRQQKLAEAGLSSKETQKLNVDNRKLTILEKLKQEGRTFHIQ